jgi:hypothetical protein
MEAPVKMRLVRLLSPLTTPEGVVPAGEQLRVDEAEARVLCGAVGLVEDMGEAEPEPESKPKKAKG